MNEASHGTNVLILVLFVIAVMGAGFAIYYFGGGTEPPPDNGNPQLPDRSVESEPRDGPSPEFYRGNAGD